jgi:KaiC/GvpD/RAD55 family RecA-like ATPase
MRSMMDQIIAAQEDINAKRALIDSSTSIGFNLQDPAKIRVELLKLSTTLELLKLSTTLEVLGLTSMMTCEITDDTQQSRFGVENFVTEGTVVLYYKRHENVRMRSMEIYKMRGSDHSKKIHPYDITPNGFVIHPHEEVYSMF